MPATSEHTRGSGAILAWGLLAAVVAEFLLLRTGTRALIHIPGLGRFDTPIRGVAEIGRFAYYVAVVFLVATLVALAVRRARTGTVGNLVLSVAVALFLVVSLAGRAGLISADVVGWISLGVVAVAAGLTVRGVRWIPVGLFALSSVAIGMSVLGQGEGGGLSGLAVDWLVMSGEVLLVLAAIASPLIVGRRVSSASVIAGAVAAVVVFGAFASGGSTLSIIILWNIGVPGWLPSVAYAMAVGALTTSIWIAATSGRPMTAIGLVLLVAGGVGVISTYQTGLVLAALLYLSVLSDRETEPEVPDSFVVDIPEPEPVGVVGG